jgi:hypothetical protein
MGDLSREPVGTQNTRWIGILAAAGFGLEAIASGPRVARRENPLGICVGMSIVLAPNVRLKSRRQRGSI